MNSTACSSNRSTKKSKSSTRTILNEKEIVHKIRKVLETLPIEILDWKRISGFMNALKISSHKKMI